MSANIVAALLGGHLLRVQHGQERQRFLEWEPPQRRSRRRAPVPQRHGGKR